jgi:hypothetical protein
VTRTDVAVAANARVGRVVDYTTDPRGLGMFRGLVAAVQRSVNPGAGQRVFTVAPMWHGDTITPQRFTGLAQLGRSRIVAPRTSKLSDEREANATNAAALAIFAERVRRGRN